MRWLIITSLTILTLVAVSATADTLNQDSTDTDNRLTTADAAIARALAYTGFDELETCSRANAENTARLVTIRDSTTPFLADSIDGQRAWVVTFSDLAVTGGDFLATFVITIDAQTGRLFKIVRRIPGFDESYWHIPSAVDIGLQAINSKGEYLGFPVEDPHIDFLQALKTVAPCRALLAEQLTALYVMHPRGGSPRPVWVLSMLGVSTPLYDDNPDAPYYLRGTCRVLIDANTGEFLIGDNWPDLIAPDSVIEKNRRDRGQ
jgi:hypothetical protein